MPPLNAEVREAPALIVAVMDLVAPRMAVLTHVTDVGGHRPEVEGGVSRFVLLERDDRLAVFLLGPDRVPIFDHLHGAGVPLDAVTG